MSWSKGGKTLSWTRGKYHYEKTLDDILKENKKVSKTDLAFTYNISKPETVIALTGVRVMTMNKNKLILDDATILIKSDELLRVALILLIDSEPKLDRGT